MKRYLKIILMLVFVLSMLAACSPKTNDTSLSDQSGSASVSEETGGNEVNSTGGADNEKIINVALSSDPEFDQFDNIITGMQLLQANAMVYEGLVKYGKKGELVPGLAESWDISEDGKIYTFHIREGVQFTDGTPLNAEVVKFSFDRWVHDPKLQSFSIAKYLDKMEIIDEMTIAFHFTEAYYPILIEFSYPRPVGIMSLNSVSPAGDPEGEFVKSIGTGAWMIGDFVKGQTATLVANPNYWGEKPAVDKIVFSVIPDPQARIYAIQNGEIDIAGGSMSSISIDSLPSIEGVDNVELKRFPSTTSYFTIFNYNNVQLSDVKVRKALNMLVDTNAIAEHLLNGVGKPAKALFQEDVPFTTEENSKWYDVDLEGAKELLAEAGYTMNADGIQEKDGKPLSFRFVFSDKEFTEWKAIAEYLQAEFAKVGVELILDNREINAYYDSLWKDKDYDLIIYRTYSDSWNPHGFLVSIFTGSEDSPAVGWDDEELTAMINDVLKKTNDVEKQKGYDAIYKKMYDDACIIPLYYPEELFLVSKRLENVKTGYDSYFPFLWNEITIKY